jgi:hypothetical protein
MIALPIVAGVALLGCTEIVPFDQTSPELLEFLLVRPGRRT